MGRDFRTNLTPNKSQWRAETILVMDQDPELAKVAVARAMKRNNAGQNGAFNLLLFGKPISIPSEFRGKDARIIILAHGESSSQYIGAFITPEALASQLKSWVGEEQIGRVALHACYAGGNRISRLEYKVKPKESFGYKLAERCGFVGSITAKTLRNLEDFISSDDDKKLTGQVHTFVLEEGGNIDNRREMTRGDKAVFHPEPGASLTNPMPPKVTFPDFPV
jgi:hypothetical protein